MSCIFYHEFHRLPSSSRGMVLIEVKQIELMIKGKDVFRVSADESETMVGEQEGPLFYPPLVVMAGLVIK